MESLNLVAVAKTSPECGLCHVGAVEAGLIPLHCAGFYPRSRAH